MNTLKESLGFVEDDGDRFPYKLVPVCQITCHHISESSFSFFCPTEYPLLHGFLAMRPLHVSLSSRGPHQCTSMLCEF
jgi:hypothetical protein